MWLSPILYIAILLLCCVWGYKYATYKPENFPPGPPRLPIWGTYLIALMSNWNFPHFPIQKWAKKYGNVFGMYFGDHPCIIACDYETCKEVLNRPEFDGKPDIYAARARNIGEKKLGIFFVDGQYWHEQRRFTLRHLRDYGFGRRFETLERMMGEQIQHLVDFMKYTKHSASDGDVISKKGAYLFPDVLYPAMMNSIMSIFGMEPAAFDSKKYRQFRTIGKSVLQLQHGMFGMGAINATPWLRHFFPKTVGYHDLIETNKVLFPFIKGVIEEIRKTKVDDDEVRCFFDRYFNKMRENENEDEETNSFTDDQLLMITIDYMFPAVSAVPVVFVQVLYCMLNYPHVMRKMQTEMDEVVGRGRLPTLDDRKDLPYTDAVIREVLRSETLVPLGILHRVIEDTTLRGFTIPKDTLLFTSLYGVHMDEKVWGDPENFRPERFIDPITKKMVKKDYSLPFGAGKRLCAGETFARNSLFLLVSGIFQNFTFQVPIGMPLPKLDNKIPGVINSQKDTCWIDAYPRD